MIFRLNASEWMDWAECWCFRCEHDHTMSHRTAPEEDGCPHVARSLIGADDPVFVPVGEAPLCTIPAGVVCSAFMPCAKCPPDDPNAERRGGETRAEWHDRLRNETLALNVMEDET